MWDYYIDVSYHSALKAILDCQNHDQWSGPAAQNYDQRVTEIISLMRVMRSRLEALRIAVHALETAL